MQARPSHHAVSVCPSVCPSRSWILSKRINVYSSGSHTILVFRIKRHGNIPIRTPLGLTGASNAGVVGRNRDSAPISGYIACCVRLERQLQYTQLRRTKRVDDTRGVYPYTLMAQLRNLQNWGERKFRT